MEALRLCLCTSHPNVVRCHCRGVYMRGWGQRGSSASGDESECKGQSELADARPASRGSESAALMARPRQVP